MHIKVLFNFGKKYGNFAKNFAKKPNYIVEKNVTNFLHQQPPINNVPEYSANKIIDNHQKYHF